MSDLTHFDDSGASRMVDVGEKPITRRVAVAEAVVSMQPETLELIRGGSAGIAASKRTSELIPLCHLLPLDSAQVDFSCPDERSVRIEARVANQGRTGVEMEALLAASVAALTVYDMCKAVDRGMQIDRVRLLEKSGGRSGHYLRDDAGESES
jgi:cyclic pyranopterin phosphate synthase